MASNGIHLIIITNPLVFMDENYLKETILKDKYSKGEIISICQNEVPIKIIIKFSDEALVDSFMTDFNDKPISDKLDYKLSLSKESKTEEEIKKENENADNNLEQFIFHEDYSNEWKINYTNTPQKSGLLYINEEGKKIGYEAIKYLIAKFSKNALQGKSILNIRFATFINPNKTPPHY